MQLQLRWTRSEGVSLTVKHDFSEHEEWRMYTHILTFANNISFNYWTCWLVISFVIFFYSLFSLSISYYFTSTIPCLFSRTSFRLGITHCSGMCLAGWFLLRSLYWSSLRERPSANCTSSTTWCRTCWSLWSTSRPPSYASTRTYMWDIQTHT